MVSHVHTEDESVTVHLTELTSFPKAQADDSVLEKTFENILNKYCTFDLFEFPRTRICRVLNSIKKS